MSTPQCGILPNASLHAIFLTFRRRLGHRGDPALRALLAGLPRQVEALNAEHPAAKTSAILAIGSDCWTEIFAQGRPAGLRQFPRIPGAIHPAPATDGDLLLHLRGERCDLLFELADQFTAQMRDWFELVECINGFRYRDLRDLTGFVDGTENPQGDEERIHAAVVGDEDPMWAGGSYVHTQRYVHKLEQWRKLPVKQQEATIGRTKLDNVELEDSQKPLTAHISRVVIEENGEELEMLRHSMPYGTPGGDRGLMFASYCRTPDVFEKMLTRMVAPSFDGRVDHMLNYTRAVTGGSFFAPSKEALASLG